MKHSPKLLFALTTALAAPAVDAHLVETGFGAFYDGIVHLTMTPSDLLMVLALALFAGQCGTASARWALFAFPLGWLVGGLVGAQWPGASVLPVWTTFSFLLAGALTALGAKARHISVAALSVLAGALHGFMNGATLGPAGASTTALVGAVTAVFCFVAVIAAEVTALPVGWPQIAVRVVGSWIAAAGLLMLGWLARTPP
ncbi:MAG: HupE/UreJ family protein [Methylococcus sp.]